ncbi:MAG: hypothetical protein KY434_08365 [Actinobacteria bacterium]|nr:hypothetical protein [Actinomycetota bacterium]
MSSGDEMNYWEGPSRWVNTALLVVVGFIGFDTLFRVLGANRNNAIVGFVRSVSKLFLSPFAGMFTRQHFLLTAVIAILGYCLLAGIILAVLRSVHTTRSERRIARSRPAPSPQEDPDATRGL